MGSLWKDPTAQMAEEALSKLDPNSAPKEDGIPAGFYKLFPKEFPRRIMEVVTKVHGSRRLPPQWMMGMLRCIPKGQGKISAENQRPITLLNTKNEVDHRHFEDFHAGHHHGRGAGVTKRLHSEKRFQAAPVIGSFTGRKGS